jgi:hypothetical protein
MVGPLKTAPSGFTHLLVAVDKFTKWVEAKPIRKVDGKTALKFVKDIVVRFGILHSIITDNGTNLSQGEVEEYCHHNGIRLDLASCLTREKRTTLREIGRYRSSLIRTGERLKEKEGMRACQCIMIHKENKGEGKVFH